jgi:hypothetical protein
VIAVSDPIPVEELQANATNAKLMYISPLLERIILLDGREAYICPWDLAALFHGTLNTYTLTLTDWVERAWCAQGCNHFWVYVMRRNSPQALNVKIDGKLIYAILDGPTVRFVIAARTKGIGAPWRP